jgi:hypothetical protein
MSEVRPMSVGRVRITEVATMLTDFAIAAICVGLSIATLIFADGQGDLAQEIWAASFGFTALAAFIGGVVHGFALHLTAAVKQRLWKATQYVMGLTGLAILASAVMAFAGGRAQPWLLGVAATKFGGYALFVRRRDEYSVVVADYGASMVALAVLAAIGWLRTGSAAAPWLFVGVVVSAVAAFIQVRKVAPHPRFNHNDLYHVVQIVALYLFYRGGLLLGDR